MEQENKTPGNRTFSFVAEINESDVEQVTENLQNIIKYNLEREEKDRLFQNKVDELKSIFEKQNLESLQNLKFDLKSKTLSKLKLDDNEEELTTTRVVTERDN